MTIPLLVVGQAKRLCGCQNYQLTVDTAVDLARFGGLLEVLLGKGSFVRRNRDILISVDLVGI